MTGFANVVETTRDHGYGVIRWRRVLHFGRTSSVEFGNPELLA